MTRLISIITQMVIIVQVSSPFQQGSPPLLSALCSALSALPSRCPLTVEALWGMRARHVPGAPPGVAGTSAGGAVQHGRHRSDVAAVRAQSPRGSTRGGAEGTVFRSYCWTSKLVIHVYGNVFFPSFPPFPLFSSLPFLVPSPLLQLHYKKY